LPGPVGSPGPLGWPGAPGNPGSPGQPGLTGNTGIIRIELLDKNKYQCWVFINTINYVLRDVGHGLLIDYVTSELHKRTFINRMLFSTKAYLLASHTSAICTCILICILSFGVFFVSFIAVRFCFYMYFLNCFNHVFVVICLFIINKIKVSEKYKLNNTFNNVN